jgi:hypothetical protein
VVVELGNEDIGQQPGTRHAARDRPAEVSALSGCATANAQVGYFYFADRETFPLGCNSHYARVLGHRVATEQAATTERLLRMIFSEFPCPCGGFPSRIARAVPARRRFKRLCDALPCRKHCQRKKSAI